MAGKLLQHGTLFYAMAEHLQDCVQQFHERHGDELMEALVVQGYDKVSLDLDGDTYDFFVYRTENSPDITEHGYSGFVVLASKKFLKETAKKYNLLDSRKMDTDGRKLKEDKLKTGGYTNRYNPVSLKRKKGGRAKSRDVCRVPIAAYTTERNTLHSWISHWRVAQCLPAAIRKVAKSPLRFQKGVMYKLMEELALVFPSADEYLSSMLFFHQCTADLNQLASRTDKELDDEFNVNLAKEYHDICTGCGITIHLFGHAKEVVGSRMGTKKKKVKTSYTDLVCCLCNQRSPDNRRIVVMGRADEIKGLAGEVNAYHVDMQKNTGRKSLAPHLYLHLLLEDMGPEGKVTIEPEKSHLQSTVNQQKGKRKVFPTNAREYQAELDKHFQDSDGVDRENLLRGPPRYRRYEYTLVNIIPNGQRNGLEECGPVGKVLHHMESLHHHYPVSRLNSTRNNYQSILVNDPSGAVPKDLKDWKTKEEIKEMTEKLEMAKKKRHGNNGTKFHTDPGPAENLGKSLGEEEGPIATWLMVHPQIIDRVTALFEEKGWLNEEYGGGRGL